ncbi:MAG: hypothetical protein JWP89_3181 [Schlesneria sp.]|nr:hypothetical protein [Schlesneria sp.]
MERHCNSKQRHCDEIEISPLQHTPSVVEFIGDQTMSLTFHFSSLEGGVLLGDNVHRGITTPALISDLRPRHCYVARASGTGKSTLLLNMILQDISAGKGVGVLDPHGDLIDDMHLLMIAATACGKEIAFTIPTRTAKIPGSGGTVLDIVQRFVQIKKWLLRCPQKLCLLRPKPRHLAHI